MIQRVRKGLIFLVVLALLSGCAGQKGAPLPTATLPAFPPTLTPWVFVTSTLLPETTLSAVPVLPSSTPIPTSPAAPRPAQPTQPALVSTVLPPLAGQVDWSKLAELQLWGRGRILTFDLTPDARQIILATQRGISVCDARTLRETRFTEVAGGVPALALSPDGKTLAISAWNSVISLIDFERGTLLRKLDNGEHGAPLNLRWLNGGQVLEVGTADEFSLFWEAATGKLLHRWYTTGNSAMAVSAAGDMIATSDWNGSVFMWNGADGRSPGRYWRESEVQALAFAPDGTQLAVGYGDGKAGLWNLLEAKLQFTLPHEDRVSALAYSPEGRMIATGSWDNSVRLWRASDGKALRVLGGHQGRVSQVRFSPDGNTLFSLAGDGILRVWQIDTGMQTGQLLDFVALGEARFGAGGLLAAAGEDDSLRLWNLASGAVADVPDALPGGISHLAVSKDGNWLAASSMHGIIRVWKLPGLALAAEVQLEDGWVSSLALSADGSWLAAGAPGELYLWSLPSGDLAWQQPTQADTPISLAFSPDGQKLAAGSMDGSLALLRVKDGGLLNLLRKEGAFISALDFNRDGYALAAGGDAAALSLWRLGGAAPTESLIQGKKGDRLSALAFSPDGAVLAAAWWDASLRFYNPSNGSLLQSVMLPAAARDVAFSADGRLIALSLEDGTVRVWGVK